MSDARDGAPGRSGSGPGRVARAWRTLSPERRLAAFASLGLFLTLFLPWYQETVIAKSGASMLQSTSVTLTGWGAFSFVEALLLLICASVLILLFRRAEGRGLSIPGGDGVVIVGAGSFATLLIVWRIFAKQGTTGHGQYATASGVEWGIFIALAVAGVLTYAGSRVRATQEPEAPRDDGEGVPFWGPVAPGGPAGSSAQPGPPADRSPTRVSAPDAARGTGPSGVDAPTRVSPRKASSGGDTPTRESRRGRGRSPFGPPVVPDDPPTIPLQSARGARDDEHRRMPLESDGAADS